MTKSILKMGENINTRVAKVILQTYSKPPSQASSPGPPRQRCRVCCSTSGAPPSPKLALLGIQAMPQCTAGPSVHVQAWEHQSHHFGMASSGHWKDSPVSLGQSERHQGCQNQRGHSSLLVLGEQRRLLVNRRHPLERRRLMGRRFTPAQANCSPGDKDLPLGHFSKGLCYRAMTQAQPDVLDTTWPACLGDTEPGMNRCPVAAGCTRGA